MGRLRVGIVGSGWVARNRHLPCWRNVGAEIVSICTRATAREVVQDFRVNHVTSVIEELLARKPDVVSVCSPPSLHLEHTRILLDYGVPVLLEKPLVVSLEEAKILSGLVDQAKVPLCPVHNFRFCRSVLRALDFLHSGRAGEVIYLTGVQISSFARRLPHWFDDLTGGLYWDESPHLIYLLDTFLGGAQLVSSRVVWGALSTPQTVTAELSGKNGVGSLCMIFGAGLSEWHIFVVTTRSLIDIDLFRDTCVVLPSDGKHGRVGVAQTTVSGVVQLFLEFARSGSRHLRGRLYYGHDELIRRFARTLEPPVDIADGLRAVHLADEILRRGMGKAASP